MTITFRGFAGSAYRQVTTEDGTLCLSSRAATARHRPTEDDWARFWSVLDSVSAWTWESAYGRAIKDGAPWSLELSHGDQKLATSGNGFEEHAPIGVRAVILALNALAGGALLTEKDIRFFQKKYWLAVMVNNDPQPPLSELTVLSRLFDPIIVAARAHHPDLRIHAYTLGSTQFGVTFLLDEPLGAAALELFGNALHDRDATFTLREFSTGTVTKLV
jgi:hypothetical protein